MTISKIEKFVVILILIFLFALITWTVYYQNIFTQAGDGTFAAQILLNFKKGNYHIRSTFADSIGKFLQEVWGRPAKAVCQLPLKAPPYQGPFGHYYFIWYFLIPLTKIFDIYWLMAGLQSFIYLSLLFFAYFFSRSQKLSIFQSLLIAILVSQHPLWRYGLFGQFYFNRFYLPFSALIIWLLTNRKTNYLILTIAIILALSTNEIYGIPTFFILTGYGLFFDKKKLKPLFKLAVFSFLYSLVSLTIIQITIGSYATQTGFIKQTFSLNPFKTVSNLIGNAWNYKTILFLAVNLIFLGILGSTNKKTLFLILIFLLPNILVDIGGAEKIGWTTHYHINYFIPLIWLAIKGFSYPQPITKQWKTTILLSLILITMQINHENLTMRNNFNLELKNVYNIYNYNREHKKIILQFRNDLRKAVGKSNSVSAPEVIVYNLIDHDIYYYPYNIDTVDKVILRVDETKKGKERFYSINFGQQDPNLDVCIRKRMEKNGFDFDNPVYVSGWAVIGRKEK